MPYKIGWDWQNDLTDKLISFQQIDVRFLWEISPEFCEWDIPYALRQSSNKVSGVILVLQHHSVYTLGSGSTPSSGPFQLSGASDELLSNTALEFDTVKVDRAGQATYHGPGQIVLYPLLDLVRIRFWHDIYKLISFNSNKFLSFSVISTVT